MKENMSRIIDCLPDQWQHEWANVVYQVETRDHRYVCLVDVVELIERAAKQEVDNHFGRRSVYQFLLQDSRLTLWRQGAASGRETASQIASNNTTVEQACGICGGGT